MGRKGSLLDKRSPLSGVITTGQPPRHMARRRWPRVLGRLLKYLGIVLLAVVVFLGSLFTYFRLRMRTEDVPNLAAKGPGSPMNVIILGSDSRAVLSDDEVARFDPTGRDRGSGRRADTIILVHIDPGRKQAVVVHFPRDLKVDYPSGRSGKINAVYQGGPEAMVEVVQEMTGLPIHHFVEVNFVGFRNMVSALGGVSVEFSRPIKDPDSGLDVPAGCVELEGDQALSFVRMRKVDDDFGRIGRQQLFVRLMLDKVVSAGTLLNPVKLVQLTNTAAKNVTTDDEVDLDDARLLARRLANLDPNRVDMRVIPSAPTRIGRTSYVIANSSQTAALFAAMKTGDPLPDYGRTGVSPIDPGDVRVTSLNGTEEQGVAARGAAELREGGFQVVGVDNADGSDYEKTTVFFKEGSEEKARLVAKPYGAAVKPLPSTIFIAGEVAAVFGNDFVAGTATPEPPKPGAKKPAKPLVQPC